MLKTVKIGKTRHLKIGPLYIVSGAPGLVLMLTLGEKQVRYWRFGG